MNNELPLHKKVWKKIDPDEYYANIQIPDDWNSLEEFVDWYLDQRIPLMIPWNAPVFRSDDACAICVFRKGRYQVELYYQYPTLHIKEHAHPRMEVITMTLGGGRICPPSENGMSCEWGYMESKLSNGMTHGGGDFQGITDGFATLTFERWDHPEEMTSAAVQWKGGVHGDIQKSTILKYKPDAKIGKDTADVTETEVKIK